MGGYGSGRKPFPAKKRLVLSGRTLNMEIGLLRQMMKRGKVWSVVAEDVRLDRENTRPVAKVLSESEKRCLFETASTNDTWLVAYCAAVLAVNTTCRGIELKHVRWQDINLFERVMTIRRSKTEAGQRSIPLNTDAMAALSRLLRRAQALGSDRPQHFIFPACQRLQIDPDRPQRTWRTAWRSLVKEAGNHAAKEAAKAASATGADPVEAIKRAAEPFLRFRFHDLRHQAITELAETGAPDATIMSLAGHLSHEMMEH